MENKEATENREIGEIYKSEAVENKQPKKKNKTVRLIVKILIWLVIIVGVIFLTLFLASKIGQFESIRAMLDFIRSEVSFTA